MKNRIMEWLDWEFGNYTATPETMRQRRKELLREHRVYIGYCLAVLLYAIFFTSSALMRWVGVVLDSMCIAVAVFLWKKRILLLANWERRRRQFDRCMRRRSPDAQIHP